jgi:hypothetical protein
LTAAVKKTEVPLTGEKAEWDTAPARLCAVRGFLEGVPEGRCQLLVAQYLEDHIFVANKVIRLQTFHGHGYMRGSTKGIHVFAVLALFVDLQTSKSLTLG